MSLEQLARSGRSDGRHSQRASLALQKLAERDPAFSSLSFWVHHRDSEQTFAPAWTDGKRVFYAQKYAEWTLEEQIGVAAHEILHVAFRHVNRGKKLAERFGGNYNPRVFNIATDAIINQTLLLSGYTLPGNCVVLTELLEQLFGERVDPRDAIAEWDAEKLYIRIMSLAKDKSAGQGPGEDEDKGQSGEEITEGYAAGKDFHDDIDQNGPAGSDARDDPTEDTEWAQRIARAKAGTRSGILGHKIADIPQVRTPWEVILRTLVNRAVTRDPRVSMLKPARRWLGMEADALVRGRDTPAYEPGIVRQNDKPRVVVGVDTSGSISDMLLKRFAGEIAAIGKKTGAEIHVLVFDTGIISETRMGGASWDSEITKIEFTRGGGTSFVDVVDRGKALDASIIVVLTDLCGPFGERPGTTPVIWAIPEEEAPAGYHPPFGTVLSLAR